MTYEDKASYDSTLPYTNTCKVTHQMIVKSPTKMTKETYPTTVKDPKGKPTVQSPTNTCTEEQ